MYCCVETIYRRVYAHISALTISTLVSINCLRRHEVSKPRQRRVRRVMLYTSTDREKNTFSDDIPLFTLSKTSDLL